MSEDLDIVYFHKPDAPLCYGDPDRPCDLVSRYEATIASDRRWIGALFQLLKEAGIQPSSRELIEAMKRAEAGSENGHH